MTVSITMGSEHQVGKICYLCGNEITEDDLSRLVGGNRHTWVHGSCYYKHEASEAWRQSHQKYAPEGEGHGQTE